MTKIYCVFGRELRTSDRDGYPVYEEFLDKCFKNKEDAEMYCKHFSNKKDYITEEELYFVVERDLQ